MTQSGSPSSPKIVPRHVHQHFLTLVLPMSDPPATLLALAQIEAELAGVAHEVIAVHSDATHASVEAIEALPERRATLRLVKRGAGGGGAALAAAMPVAGGDIVALLDDFALGNLRTIVRMADLARQEHCALVIADWPRGAGRDRRIDLSLGALAGMTSWNALSGLRIYAADFLDRQNTRSTDDRALSLELAVNAQLQQETVATFHVDAAAAQRHAPATQPLAPYLLRRALLVPMIVWTLWGALTVAGLVWMVWMHGAMNVGFLANVALPSAGTFAFTLAVRRVRGHLRMADAFFSLVLLNPLYSSHVGFDPTLLATGLLGLMAGAIIAMKSDHLRRYVAVMALALALVLVAESFLILLPPLVIWLVLVAYNMAKSGRPQDRFRGFIVLAAAEIGLLIFCLACLYTEAPLAAPETVFAHVVSLADFPLLVLAIILLALGWRPGPRKKVPPYFAGMLALLLGLLTLLVNNLPTGPMATLPAEGTDQTAFILCLLYTVFALHGPRRLQWIAPPLLLAAALAYILLRP